MVLLQSKYMENIWNSVLHMVASVNVINKPFTCTFNHNHPLRWYYYCPYFTDELVTSPRSYSWQGADQEIRFTFLWSQILFLTQYQAFQVST